MHDQSAGPIFVTGTQRSGTTLVCRVLSAHPGFYIKNEMPGVPAALGRLGAAEIVARISAAMRGTELACAIEELLARGRVRRWGLKDPRLTDHLDDIEAKFPFARVIVIIRDGPAVARSYRKAHWGMGCNAYSAAQRWSRERRAQNAFVARRPEMAMGLRYEDLLADPHAELERLCRFIGVTLREEMLRYHEQPTDIERQALAENVFHPLEPARAQRWRSELSRRAIRVFESVAGTVLRANGYPLLTTEPHVGGLERVGYVVHQAVVGELELQYQLRLKPWLASMRRA